MAFYNIAVIYQETAVSFVTTLQCRDSSGFRDRNDSVTIFVHHIHSLYEHLVFI